jgi:DNA polymerase III epsilon subunit-like protein
MVRLVLSIDLETTGLNEKITGVETPSGEIIFTRESAVIQIAGQILIHDTDKKTLKIMETFDLKCRPHEGAFIHEEALERNGMSHEEIMLFPEPKEQIKKLKKIFRKYMDKTQYCTWDEKFFWLGYSTSFDIKFLDAFFQRHNRKKLHDFTNFYPVDLYPEMVNRVYLSPVITSDRQSNMRLETFCAQADYPIRAHDALQDSLATTDLFIYSLMDGPDEIQKIHLPNGKLYNPTKDTLTKVLG